MAEVRIERLFGDYAAALEAAQALRRGLPPMVAGDVLLSACDGLSGDVASRLRLVGVLACEGHFERTNDFIAALRIACR